MKTNVTMLYGSIETDEERVDHLVRIRELQDETHGFLGFIPLAFHPDGTPFAHLPATSGLLDLRVIAASRLMLDNLDHVKAYWVQIGEKFAPVALHFGADDLVGTVTEETITHAAGATTEAGLSRRDMERLIRSAGREPVRARRVLREGRAGRGRTGREGQPARLHPVRLSGGARRARATARVSGGRRRRGLLVAPGFPPDYLAGGLPGAGASSSTRRMLVPCTVRRSVAPSRIGPRRAELRFRPGTFVCPSSIRKSRDPIWNVSFPLEFIVAGEKFRTGPSTTSTARVAIHPFASWWRETIPQAVTAARPPHPTIQRRPKRRAVRSGRFQTIASRRTPTRTPPTPLAIVPPTGASSLRMS